MAGTASSETIVANKMAGMSMTSSDSTASLPDIALKSQQSQQMSNPDADAMPEEVDILTDVANRFVMFPIRYQSIWNMYKKAESAFWTAEEIDLSKDMNDWEKLSDNDRTFIKNVLAFFAGSDGIVNENLSVRFMNDVKPPEAKAFYGFQIAMENIHCVKGDTMILTDLGYFPIDSLQDTYVRVWNGERFSEVKVLKTSESSDMNHVLLNNGMSLVCTPQHKWVLESGERVWTAQLKSGDRLLPFQYPSQLDPLSDPQPFPNADMHGFMCLDACMPSSMTAPDSGIFGTSTLHDKYFVPINYSKTTKLAWVSGLLRHATVNEKDVMACATLFSHRSTFIKEVQLLLTTLAIPSSIRIEDTDPSRLTLSMNSLVQLLQLGLTVSPESGLSSLVKQAKMTIRSVTMTPVQCLSVEKVYPMQIKMPTYCFEEPQRGMGVFNGILTGQSETYSLLIDTYVKDPMEKARLFNAIDTIPCIKRKAQWALKWIENQKASFATRLVAFACVEGIFFSGAFCAIFWLKERGLMPGLCFSNELISRDESQHTEFAMLLYSMLPKQKLSESVIRDIVMEAVEIETEFIVDSIPCSLLGMNSDLMTQYIKFVADRLVVQLGYEKIYHVTNPFHFMDRICLDTKTNFFENREGNYAKANVGTHSNSNGSSQGAFVFTKDEDF